MSEVDLAASLDAQIRALAEQRAALLSSHPVVPPQDPAQLYRADNMLWHVRPATGVAAVEIAFYNPGLGWVSVLMSRAQIEDLQTEINFAVTQLPTIVNLSSPAKPEAQNGEVPV
jgi:hypothetical protein